MTERVRSQVQASEMRFVRKTEEVTLFNKVRIALRFKNLLTSNRYFSELKDLSLDDLAIKAECLRKDYPKTSFTCQSKWEKTSWTT